MLCLALVHTLQLKLIVYIYLVYGSSTKIVKNYFQYKRTTLFDKKKN